MQSKSDDQLYKPLPHGITDIRTVFDYSQTSSSSSHAAACVKDEYLPAIASTLKRGSPGEIAKTVVPCRNIIEWCCGDDSLLGNEAFINQQSKCRSTRITFEKDASTKIGLDAALKSVKINSRVPNLVWSASPCTGGSPMNSFNNGTPEGRKKTNDHVRLHEKIFAKFQVLAESLDGRKDFIAIEWPRNCKY